MSNNGVTCLDARTISNGDYYEALQELLDRREAELESIKEERRDKDAAINFLKTKIVSLQNQNKVHSDTALGPGNRGTPPLDSDTNGVESLQLALEERERVIADLETELSRVRQETERSQRAVHRLSSGGVAWELEEARRRLAEREREVESLRRSLEWQESESTRIAERSAADLEDLRQHFIVRDREVAELKRALEDLEGSRREHHLEVELRRQAEENRRLSAKSQRSEEEAADLRQQLRHARDEVESLWRTIREQSLQQDEESALHSGQERSVASNGFVHASPLQSPRLSVPSRPSRMASADLSLVSEAVASRNFTASVEAPPRNEASVGSSRLTPRGSLPTAGAEAAAGDSSPPLIAVPISTSTSGSTSGLGLPKTDVSQSLSGDRQPVLPAIPHECEFEVCEAADEGAGTSRRTSEVARSDVHINRAEICTAEDLQLERQLPSPEEKRLPSEECTPVSATYGGAVFTINFEGEEDIAAKEAKKQRMARQIERRRQARLQSGPEVVPKALPETGEELASVAQDAVVIVEAECLQSPRIEPEAECLQSPRIEPCNESLYSPRGSPRLTTLDDICSPSLTARIDPVVGCTSPLLEQISSEKAPVHIRSSKFAGLRDEMKRRRSKNVLGANEVSDPVEMAEAVIAEANSVPVPMSSRVAAVEEAVAVAVGSVAAASAVASRVLASASLTNDRASFGSPTSPTSASGLVGTSPLHSARTAKTTGKSPGERVITTTSSLSSCLAFDLGQTGNPINGHSQRSCPQSPQASPQFYIPIGTLPPSPSSAVVPPASVPVPLSPGGYSQASSTTRHPQPVQRLRSMPQESTAATRSSASGELDRSRRNNLSYSSRSVNAGASSNGGHNHSFTGTGGGSGSSRFPAGQSGRLGSTDVASVDAEQDTLHDAVVRFCMQRPPGRYPLVRISRGVYLYGNKKLVVAMHNEKLMARIGGGFVNLESYLIDCDRTAPPATPTSPASASAHFEPASRLAGIATSRSVLPGRRR